MSGLGVCAELLDFEACVVEWESSVGLWGRLASARDLGYAGGYT